MSSWKLSVDDSRWMGHGRCYTVSPGLLADDEEGFVTLRGSSMPIGDDQFADAEAAHAAWPERALTLQRGSCPAGAASGAGGGRRLRDLRGLRAAARARRLSGACRGSEPVGSREA